MSTPIQSSSGLPNAPRNASEEVKGSEKDHSPLNFPFSASENGGTSGASPDGRAGLSPEGQAALALAWAELDGEPLEIGEGDDDPEPPSPAAPYYRIDEWGQMRSTDGGGSWLQDEEGPGQDDPTEETLPQDLPGWEPWPARDPQVCDPVVAYPAGDYRIGDAEDLLGGVTALRALTACPSELSEGGAEALLSHLDPTPRPWPPEPSPALLAEVRRLCSLLRWALAPQLCAAPEQLAPVIEAITLLESGRCAALEIGRLSVTWRGRDPELLDALVSLDRALDHDLVAQISTLHPTGWGAREWLRAAQRRVIEYGASAPDPRAVSLAPDGEGPDLPPELGGAECVRLFRAAAETGRLEEIFAAQGDRIALHQLYRVLVGPRVYSYAINPRSQDRRGSATAEIVGVLAMGALLALSLGYLLGLVG